MLKYVFVTGASFSGSTLLVFLLNAHPQMVSVSEMGPFPAAVDFDRYKCSCGRLLLECPFYLALQRKMSDRGHPFDLRDWRLHFQVSKHRLLDIGLARPLRSVALEAIRDRLVRFWPGYRRKISCVARRIGDFASSALELSGKEYYVDAEKDPARIKFLRDVPGIDLWVIHLIRDIRGVTASFMKNASRDVEWGARRWCIVNMNSERARRFVAPERWLRVHYEDFCADPQRTLDRIADFVGTVRSPVPEDFYATKHHIVGNRMRHGTKRGGTVSTDTTWKQRLTQADLRKIAQVGGKTSQYFGYT